MFFPSSRLLTKLDRRSVQTLHREVSSKDYIIALKTASEAVKEKLLGNISMRVRNYIESEISFLEDTSPEEIRDTQRRILQQLAQSAAAGDLQWPADNPHVVRHKLDAFFHAQQPEKKVIGPKKITATELVAQLRKGPLEQMSLDQLADFFMDMSYLSRSDGIHALEPLQEALEGGCDPNSELLRCGLELVLDQVPFKRVVETLEAQMETQLEWFKKACKMVVEGAAAMQPGVEPKKMEEAVRQAAM